MSQKSVSAVLEKLIRRLCLGDFPCRTDAKRQREDGSGRAEAEETRALLDLLRCPHSPWHQDHSWSPQAASLRELAVRAPQRLHENFVYTFFTTLRVLEKDISVIDEGLLKFSKLEELVLSANHIREIRAEHLPSTLKVLELRSNRLCSLDGLIGRPLPCLQYLGLASNPLDSCHDVAQFTGRRWPQLVCLDLGDCEFQDQRALLDALSTLPRLRTLVLEGNPFTLAPCYPGFAVDRLPQLFYLDSMWISPQERDCFRGLAQMSSLNFDLALAVVRVGSLRGIPDPLMCTENNTADCPLSSHNYSVTYDFFSHKTPAPTSSQISNSESDSAKRNRNNVTSGDPKPELDWRSWTPTPDKSDLVVCADVGRVSTCSTSKVTWSEEMNFDDAQTYVVDNLDGFKRFCHRGLEIKIVAEKSPGNPGSIRDKHKIKKKPAVQLPQGAPIRRVLGSVRVPLQSLLKGPQKVHVLCNFGLLGEESGVEATPPGNGLLKIQEDEEAGRELCRGQTSSLPPEVGESSEVQETAPSPERSASVPSEAATVELSVELKKWRSLAEAHQLRP